MSPRTVRLLPLVLLCLSPVAGCGDTTPTASEHTPLPPSRASLTVTAIDAYSTADQYDERQPLAPFGVSEWEFNEDPELVTDDQFTQQGESTLSDWEVPQIETDAYEVEEHANACDGSRPRYIITTVVMHSTSRARTAAGGSRARREGRRAGSPAWRPTRFAARTCERNVTR